MPYSCDTHPDRQAALLVTNLENGDSVTACGECVFPLTTSIATTVLPEGRALAIVDATPDPDPEQATPAAAPATEAPATEAPAPVAIDLGDDPDGDLPDLADLVEARLAARDAAEDETGAIQAAPAT